MKKTTFLIDGFNLYGSVRDLQSSRGINSRWLDIKSLLSSYLGNIDRESVLEDIYFFTAIQNYLAPQHLDKINRHKKYISCLESMGLKVVYGNFKRKNGLICRNCGRRVVHQEEKETDVSLGIKMFELLHQDSCDIVVIVSGDTDFVPAIKSCKNNFPQKTIVCLFPFNRGFSHELRAASDLSFKIGWRQYQTHLLQNNVSFSDGINHAIPSEWINR